MNNLKFRAWDKANKEMLKIDVIDFFLEETRVLENDGSCFSMKFSDVEIMQSTGFHDKRYHTKRLHTIQFKTTQ